MARKVFFSFHFEKDNWRAAQIRNHWITKPDRESAGYIDSVEWEKLKRLGDYAIERWIQNEMTDTSVTVVLIGQETSNRRWVLHEIQKTLEMKHGLIGIYVNLQKDQNGLTTPRGTNPFDELPLFRNGQLVGRLSSEFPTYDWVTDNGYTHFGYWVEKAAVQAGK